MRQILVWFYEMQVAAVSVSASLQMRRHKRFSFRRHCHIKMRKKS